jgi:DNA helicase-2/ATP-dependent DNA helicase PcrA
MKFIADLHIHSPWSRSTSPEMTLENLHAWAQLKGITLLGTGDFTHPARLAEIREKLVPAEPGLYRLKNTCRNDRDIPQSCRKKVRFLLTAEVSTIYSRERKTRKVHHLLLGRDLRAVQRINGVLAKIGNLISDGRPILSLDSRELLKIVLESSPENLLIPAHAWTPHFSVFGAFSRFSTLEECYGDLAAEILAIETGLSSDPPMNHRLSQLDRLTLVSNSDAHSLSKLMREANLFDTALTYPAVREALRADSNERTFLGTIEFFPQEGKYHYDGHRVCRLRIRPSETVRHEGRCPKCGRNMVTGVLHRVQDLADRPEEAMPASAKPFQSLIPLQEILAEVFQVGAGSKKVQRAYRHILSVLGDEYTVLVETSIGDLKEAVSPVLAEAIRRVRQGEVQVSPGYDGVYGEVTILDRLSAGCGDK